MDIFFQFDRLSFIFFYLITILWILEFVIFPSHFKSKDSSETKSFLKILAVILISHTLTLLMTGLDLFILENTWGIILFYLSLVTYPLGLALRYVSIIYLGKYFTRDVEVSETQELVSKGPYLLLRHPLYLGLYLLTISVPLFFSNWMMSIISAVMMFLILNHRMTIEENMMENILKDTYKDWKDKRHRFIPFIY